MLNKLFKSILEQDTAPIVVCDLDHIIVNANDNLTNKKDLIILEKIKILNENNKNKVLGYIDALLDMSV